jgi:hypothetical protein
VGGGRRRGRGKDSSLNNCRVTIVADNMYICIYVCRYTKRRRDERVYCRGERVELKVEGEV